MTSRECKDKRNARVRRMCARKLQDMQRMRETVAQLEHEKYQLETWYDQDVLAATNGPQELSADSIVERNRYLHVLKEIEHLRLENRELGEELARRDRFCLVVDGLIDEARTLDAEVDNGVPTECPLNENQVNLVVSALENRLRTVYQRACVMQRCTQAEVFGWSDLRCNVGNYVDFAVKKSFANRTASTLLEKAWHVFSTPQLLQQVCPAMLPTPPIFHRFGDDVLLGLAPSVYGKPLDCFLLARSRTDEGQSMLMTASFQSAAVLADVPMDDLLQQECYWVFDDLATDPDHPTPRAIVQFGGTMPNAPERTMRWMIAEFVFNLIRWETMGVQPVMLVRTEQDAP